MIDIGRMKIEISLELAILSMYIVYLIGIKAERWYPDSDNQL